MHHAYVDRFFSIGLRRVGMKEDAATAAQCSDLSDWMKNAGFVVAVHDRHQQSLVRDRCFEMVKVESSVSVDSEVGHVESEPFKLFTGV